MVLRVLIFVLLLVEFEGMKVNSESGFVGKTFQLTALSFEVAKLFSVAGGGMGEGEKFGFFGGDDVKTGGEFIIVVINQDSRRGSWNRGGGRDSGS